jgi:menaquinone-dependent protoporphyrinogen oxidase
MEEGEKATKQLEEAFPVELLKHASATGIFGGEFNFEKMNFIERAAIRKIAGVDKSVSKIKQEELDRFLALMAA